MFRPTNPRRLLLALLVAAAAAPAMAQITINIGIAPPAPRYEVAPQMPPGHVWAPGYWGWNGNRHVWVRGRTIVERAGYRWAPDRWEQRERGYARYAGHWERDPDHKPVKVKKPKKEKKPKHHDRGQDHDDDHGPGNSGGHGKGGRHGA